MKFLKKKKIEKMVISHNSIVLGIKKIGAHHKILIIQIKRGLLGSVWQTVASPNSSSRAIHHFFFFVEPWLLTYYILPVTMVFLF